MNVRISLLASFKLERLLNHIEENWSRSSRDRFLSKLNSVIETIKQNPEICQKSETRPELRRAVVTKQSSLLYQIQKETIFVVTIFDNRQDQDKLDKEIKRHFG